MAIEIRLIENNKKDFLPLLLLGDEQESCIDKYLERGDLFALYDDGLRSVCIVTDEGGSVLEIQNLATDERYQRQGYATRLIEHIAICYRGRYSKIILGTGDVPGTLAFYAHRGFSVTHRIADYFTTHYDHPMIEEGVLLKDKVYLERKLPVCVNIRTCRPSDEKDWIALNREFMEFEIKEGSPWNGTEKTPDTAFKNTFYEALEHPELITLLVLEEDGIPIGFANLMTIFSIWAHGKALVLDDLYIKKEHQGKGHGKEAMAFIEAYARENGYKRLQFQSEPSNPNAKAFYESLGFASADMFFFVKHFS